MSPVLFNIFINDVFEGAGNLGVKVRHGYKPPGNMRKREKLPDRFPGLLFADDLVTFSATRTKLKAMCAHIENWTKANEMECGIVKCGIMVINGDMARLRRRSLEFKIAGEAVPIVDEYSYLGVTITPDLSIGAMAQVGLKKGEATHTAIRPFLGCSDIPLFIRKHILTSVVLPRMLYGAELYGMNKKLTDKFQQLLDRSLKVILGVNPKAPVSKLVLWEEFNIPPISALAAARRARAFQKAASLKTKIALLVTHPYRCAKWTWATGTLRWLKTQITRCRARMATVPQVFVDDTWLGLEPKVLGQRLVGLVWEREKLLRANINDSSRAYVKYKYAANRLTSAKVGKPVFGNSRSAPHKWQHYWRYVRDANSRIQKLT